MAEQKLTKDDALVLLQNKYAELKAAGETRFPQRSDFTDREVVAIKAFLGPWPRALEAAGIKEPRSDDRIEKNRDKRARAKRNRIMALKRLEKERKKQAARNGGNQS